MNKKHILLLCLSWLWTSMLMAQLPVKLPFVGYGPEQGLQNLTLFHLDTDDDGMFYLNGLSALVTYDGVSFQQHRPEAAGQDFTIYDLEGVDRGAIVLSRNWVYYFVDGRFSPLFKNDSRFYMVEMIDRKRDGRGFLAGKEGLFSVDIKTDTVTLAWKGRLGHHLRQYKDGVIFHDGQDIIYWDGKKSQSLYHTAGEPIFIVDCRDDRLYWWEGNSLCIRQPNGTIGRFLAPINPRGEEFFDLLIDRDQQVWTATMNHSFFVFGDGSFKWTGVEEGIQSTFVSGFHQDDYGSVWMTTQNTGIARLLNNFLVSIPLSSQVLTVFEVEPGEILVGEQNADNHLLSITGDGIAENRKSRFPLKQLPDRRETWLLNVVPGSQGDIWLLYPDRLLQYRQGKLRQWPFSEAIADSYVTCGVVNSQGELVLGTLQHKGLLLFKDGKFYRDEKYKKVENLDVVSLLAQGEDLLIGAREGLYRYSRGRYEDLQKKWHLEGASFHALFQDSRGRTWIGNQTGGAHVIENDRLSKHYGLEKGLPGLSVNHITEDGTGRIWLGTNNGLGLVTEKGTIFPITSKDGFCGDDVTYRGLCIDKQGRVWAGARNYLNVIDTAALRLDKPVPTVRLKGIRMKEEAIAPDRLKKLSYRENFLSFAFYSTNFYNEKSNLYSYRLLPGNTRWSDWSSSGRVQLFYLPPGAYRLQVKTKDLWQNESPLQEIGFTIRPPVWKTWWFTLVALILFALLSYLAIHFLQQYLALTSFWKRQHFIGQYKILEKVGSGGMGTVYKAVNTVTRSEPVALKVLREEYAADPIQRKRFIYEAALIDQVDHPNIIHVIERGEVDGKLYIAMEYLQGRTLRQVLRDKQRLPIAETRDILIQLTGAIAKLHSKNIIHRDLKPENIMLVEKGGQDNFVKLLDFGVARTESVTRMTETGMIVGTVHYLSPEQISGEISLASDIYSLGVMIYEITTGEVPFPGETITDVMKQILEKSPIEPRRLRSDIPAALNDLILSMMSKLPADRPPASGVLHTWQTLFTTN